MPVKEKCVICGKDTNEELDKEIKNRKYYIDGSGQLCKKCYEEVFLKTKE